MKLNRKIVLAALAVATTEAFVPSSHKARSLSFVSPPTVYSVQTACPAVDGVLDPPIGASTTVVAPPEEITEADVRSLFYIWNDALATGDSATVASLYAEDGFLLPTVSDVPRTDFDSIKDYFDNFLLLKPQGKILEGKIKIGHNWAKDAGIYEFTMGRGKNNGSKVKARYSFIYVFEEGEWKISHHHSSAMPEQMMAKGREITEEEVRDLFYLWNDALASLDPDSVAKRYSNTPILLPTVSDEPRTDYDSIKDYFVNFLALKPQGKILESHVSAGNNWAKDAGIYEFTLGATGDVVKARYSFIYVFEDGEWKISHHHSSTMPESNANKKQQISEDEVKDLFYLWNDALATLDSNVVAMRYAKDSVLLPTVSDEPRTDYEGKKDYFDNFLKLKPQGKILQSHTMVADGWAKDVGIYEFTLGVDGSKVKARYSFVYVFEDGEWKISHHHSSQMPESITPKGQELRKNQVRDLFKLWNDAVDTLDSNNVAKLYAKDAVLFPTVGDEPCTNNDAIKGYFDKFLELNPKVFILESHVTTGLNWAKDTGIYEFTIGSSGVNVKARYSFIYAFEDGEWKIAQHHSSTIQIYEPESSAVLESNASTEKHYINEAQVKDLFHRWNAALASLDSDAVAMRYAKNSVLLPSVSDEPITDYDGKKDYFESFLKLKPEGKILENHIMTGDNWAKDMGIYEFTMGTGSVVKARYSFVYVFEDGDWKISHHHASVIPDARSLLHHFGVNPLRPDPQVPI